MSFSTYYNSIAPWLKSPGPSFPVVQTCHPLKTSGAFWTKKYQMWALKQQLDYLHEPSLLSRIFFHEDFMTETPTGKTIYSCYSQMLTKEQKTKTKQKQKLSWSGKVNNWWKLVKVCKNGFYWVKESKKKRARKASNPWNSYSVISQMNKGSD